MSKITEIRVSGQTYTIEDSSALHNLDLSVTSDGSNAVAGSGIYSAITAATAALAETVGQEMSAKTDNADFTAYTAATEAVLSGKADQSDVDALSGTVTAHTADTDIHVTTSDKETWNAKADISDIPSVSGYADSVKYNSTSKYVEFYHGGTGGTKVFEYDASPFLIDGMVQNVEIKDVEISGETVTCLVVSFNTDAGKQDINIPLTEIFDASNYYTTAQTDTKISEATSSKVETSTFTAYTAATDATITGINATLTAHTADTDIHVTTSDKSTWSAKQNALSAGTGIDITNDVISVTGVPMTIDTQMSDSSTNPVQNNTIKAYVDTEVAKKNQVITVDGTTLVIS